MTGLRSFISTGHDQTLTQVQHLTQNNMQVNQNFQSNGAGSLQAAWERVEREKEERRLLAHDPAALQSVEARI